MMTEEWRAPSQAVESEVASTLYRWRDVVFGDLLAEPVRNGIYKPKSFHGRGVKIVNMGELFSHPRLRGVEMKRLELTDSERRRALLAEGDLLFARRSLTAEGAGRCSIVKELSGETTFESSIIRARPDPTKADSDFLYYYFRAPYGRYLLGTILRQVAVAGITGTDLTGLTLNAPEVEEQQAIAGVLSSLDEKIDLLRSQNQTLEAMAKSLFRQWFVEEAEDAWEPCTVGEVFTIRGGTTPSTKEARYWDGDIAWTSPKDLASGAGVYLFDTSRKITALGLAQVGSGLLPSGTVLLSSRAPIGYLAITDIPVAINQGYIAMVCDDGIPNYFAYLWCKHHMDDIKAAGNGSTFEEISKSNFKALPFRLPPAEKLEAFDEIATPLFGKLRSNELQARQLATLRDTLLPKLMSGEVRVAY